MDNSSYNFITDSTQGNVHNVARDQITNINPTENHITLIVADATSAHALIDHFSGLNLGRPRRFANVNDTSVAEWHFCD